MLRWITIAAFCEFLVLASPASAERLGKGRSVVSVGMSGHRGQFIQLAGLVGSPEYLAVNGPGDAGEVGGEAALARFLNDHWTIGLDLGYHASREKTGDQAPFYINADIFRTQSWTLRIGSDRYVLIDDGMALYAGPGVFVTQGRETFELTQPSAGGGIRVGPYSAEYGLNGRIGMYARLVGRSSLCAHIGQSFSHTSARAATSNKTWEWWSSAPEGAFSLAFDF